MPAIFLREADVEKLIDIPSAIEALETVFRKQAMTEVANISRGRARTDHGLLHIMGAAAKTLGAMCCKVYTTTRQGARFLVHHYDGKTGELLAVIEAELLGQIRTGATSGVAAKLMARPDASTAGIFGSGKQARTQLEAVCAVRPIQHAVVYSPTEEHRARFASEMSAKLSIKVEATDSPEAAAKDRDVVITATDAVEPFLLADWIREGTHLNVVGSNFLGKAEIKTAVIAKCDPIVVDDKEQARIEAGDLVFAIDEKVIRWSDVAELGNVVVGRFPARHDAASITLFKSVGAGLEDLAVAKLVYERALERGLGEPLPF